MCALHLHYSAIWTYAVDELYQHTHEAGQRAHEQKVHAYKCIVGTINGQLNALFVTFVGHATQF